MSAEMLGLPESVHRTGPASLRLDAIAADAIHTASHACASCPAACVAGDPDMVFVDETWTRETSINSLFYETRTLLISEAGATVLFKNVGYNSS